jgi:solute carrier family 24 (sodium/potassium/calcium exchanger), member 4
VRSTVSDSFKTSEGIANPAFVKAADDKKSDAAVGPPMVSAPPVDDDDDDGDDGLTLWAKPEGSKFTVFWWIFTWPIRLLLTVTIPNVKTYPRLFFLTFFMCMIMLAICSYIIFWMVVIIGFTFGIPESIMGMTLLAAGGCLPEATSAVLMIRTGSGALGVSNSLGANSLAIMFSLGFPWLLRNMVDGAWTTGANHNIGSSGLEWVVLSLILAVISLYMIVMLAKYVLRTRLGFILAGTYIIFVTFAILVEMDILISNDHC